MAALSLLLWACSGHHRDPAATAAACNALSKALTDQQQAFINQAQAIRSQHLLLRDYDRQMITAISTRRTTLQATRLTELSGSDDLAGCSGESLEAIRRQAQYEMANLRDFLKDFNRALKNDPQGVYIDSP